LRDFVSFRKNRFLGFREFFSLFRQKHTFELLVRMVKTIFIFFAFTAGAWSDGSSMDFSSDDYEFPMAPEVGKRF
jgi:hypothetical protein